MDIARNEERVRRKYQPRPIRVRPDDLKTTIGVRRLTARIADAVSRGVLSPGKAGAMLKSVALAVAMSEQEVAEQMIEQARQLNAQPIARRALVHEPQVIDAEVEAA